MSTKIYIVDDHPVTREGILSILKRDESIKIVGEAKNGMEAVEFLANNTADVVIMDVSMPVMSGMDATKEILKVRPDVKIMALSIHSGEKFVKKMLDSGAVGYLVKDEAPEELIKAIKKILNGDIFLSSSVVRAALKKKKHGNEIRNLQVLKTKLLRPTVLSSFLVKQNVIDELEANVDKPLSLISAGAGYGKSVAVSQWLEHSKRLHIWISLDNEHNNLRIFLLYLVTSFENLIPGSMAESKKAISGSQLPSPSELSRIILIDLGDIELDSIIVLDDYHKIHNQDIHDLINEWLRFPPPAVHLSILTRRDPILSLNSHRMNGRMTEIRMDKLSFTQEETIEYFDQKLKMDLDVKTVQILQELTEGWIIALILSSIIISKTEDVSNLIQDIEGNLDSISEYLVMEVLSKLPDKLQRSMLVASTLDRFSSELIDELFHDDKDIDGYWFIKHLKKSNLFIVELDLINKWFRFHHLFQSILQNLLKDRFSREEISNYHMIASNWFEDHLFLEEAIDYALLAENYDGSGEIIKKYRLELLKEGKYNRLESLIRKIPIEVVESDPELLINEFHIQWNYNNFVRLGELEEKMERVLDLVEKDSLVEGEYLFFLGYSSFFLRNDLKKALSLFKIASGMIPESASGSRGMLDVISMIFKQLGGSYSEVCQFFSKSINLNIPTIRKFRLYEGFFAASIDQVNMEALAENYLSAIVLARESKIPDAISAILYMSANYLMRVGRVSEASEYLKEVADIRYLAHSRVATDAISSLMICYCMMNENDKALNALSLLDRFTSSLSSFHRSFYWSTKARYHLMNNNSDEVREILPKLRSHVLDLVMWLDVPEISYARALIFEGTTTSLDLAEEELTKLADITNALHNRIHFYEVKALEAILHFKRGHLEKAEEALLTSFEIAEPEGMILFFIELGESFLPLTDQLPSEFRYKQFITRIKDHIHNRQNKNVVRKTRSRRDKLNALTRRELKVLTHVANGLQNQEIAEKLFNSEETIKKHIYNMFKKLNVKNRLSLVMKAKEKGILN